MYDRDIIFDLDNRMVHIYNDIKCEKNSKTMGRYLDNEDEEKTPNIVFGTSTQLFNVTVNTDQPLFILGIVFLALGCFGFALIFSGVCDSDNKRARVHVPVGEDETEMVMEQVRTEIKGGSEN